MIKFQIYLKKESFTNYKIDETANNFSLSWSVANYFLITIYLIYNEYNKYKSIQVLITG